MMVVTILHAAFAGVALLSSRAVSAEPTVPPAVAPTAPAPPSPASLVPTIPYSDICNFCGSPDKNITLPDVVVPPLNLTCGVVALGKYQFIRQDLCSFYSTLVQTYCACSTITAVVTAPAQTPAAPIGTSPASIPSAKLQPTAYPTSAETCNLCGSPDLEITLPTAFVASSNLTCVQFSLANTYRLLGMDICNAAVLLVKAYCGCAPVATKATQPPAAPSVLLPPTLPTPLPVSTVSRDPPTQPPTRAVRETLRSVTIDFSGVIMMSPTEVDRFQQVMEQWFERFYADGATTRRQLQNSSLYRGLSGLTTTVLVTGQTPSQSTAVRAYAVNKVKYDQTLAYTQLDSSLDATAVATRPFRDAAAYEDLVSNLKDGIASFTSVQTPLSVPIVGGPSMTAAYGSGGISTGAIAGIVVGAVVAIAAVVAAVAASKRSRGRTDASKVTVGRDHDLSTARDGTEGNGGNRDVVRDTYEAFDSSRAETVSYPFADARLDSTSQDTPVPHVKDQMRSVIEISPGGRDLGPSPGARPGSSIAL